MAETMNMMSITVKQFTNEVEQQMDDGDYTPMIGIGVSGVGKTMSIAETCKRRGWGLCELRLVTLTETDIIGIPDLVQNPDGTKSTTYASNELLPIESRDGEYGILVLDEITSASPTIRAAAYQLLDSKRALGNYKLPPKWKVVALGNGVDDGGVFSGMENAFLSRGTCYRIEPDKDAWREWAKTHGINPTITAYMEFDSTYFHKMDTDAIASIFPCPRSWANLSLKLNNRERRDKENGGTGILPEDTVELLAAGAVGVEAATAFKTFYMFNDSLSITSADVINGSLVNVSGEPGHRTFTLKSDEGLTKEGLYILSENVLNDLAKLAEAEHFTKLNSLNKLAPDRMRLRQADESSEFIKGTNNFVKFLIALSGINLEVVSSLMYTINSSNPAIAEYFTSDKLEEYIPEYAVRLSNKIGGYGIAR